MVLECLGRETQRLEQAIKVLCISAGEQAEDLAQRYGRRRNEASRVRTVGIRCLPC